MFPEILGDCPAGKNKGDLSRATPPLARRAAAALGCRADAIRMHIAPSHLPGDRATPFAAAPIFIGPGDGVCAGLLAAPLGAEDVSAARDLLLCSGRRRRRRSRAVSSAGRSRNSQGMVGAVQAEGSAVRRWSPRRQRQRRSCEAGLGGGEEPRAVSDDWTSRRCGMTSETRAM